VRTEPLLALRTAALDNLDDPRPQRLDRWHVVGENTHVSRLGGDVHLEDLGRGIQSLCEDVRSETGKNQRRAILKYLVRQGLFIHVKSASIRREKEDLVGERETRTRVSLMRSLAASA
jgi:hypothetical protein